MFIDLQQAYDAIPHPALLARLRAAGCSEASAELLRRRTTETQARVTLRHQAGPPFPIRRGVPQGAPISPTLFNLWINDLLTSLGPKAVAFADDIALLASSPTEAEALLETVEQWCKRNGHALNIGPTKSAFVVLRPAKAVQQLQTLSTPSGVTIPRVASYRYLGVEVNEALTTDAFVEANEANLATLGARIINLLTNLNVPLRILTRFLAALIFSRWRYAAPALRWLKGGAEEVADKAVDTLAAQVLHIHHHTMGRLRGAASAEVGWKTGGTMMREEAAIQWARLASSTSPALRELTRRHPDRLSQLLANLGASAREQETIPRMTKGPQEDQIHRLAQHATQAERMRLLRRPALRNTAWLLQWETPGHATYLETLAGRQAVQTRALFRLGVAPTPRRLLRDGRNPEERKCACGEMGDEPHYLSLACPRLRKCRKELLHSILKLAPALTLRDEGRADDATGIVISLLTSGSRICPGILHRLRDQERRAGKTRAPDDTSLTAAAVACREISAAEPASRTYLTRKAGHVLTDALRALQRERPRETKETGPSRQQQQTSITSFLLRNPPTSATAATAVAAAATEEKIHQTKHPTPCGDSRKRARPTPGTEGDDDDDDDDDDDAPIARGAEGATDDVVASAIQTTYRDGRTAATDGEATPATPTDGTRRMRRRKETRTEGERYRELLSIASQLDSNNKQNRQQNTPGPGRAAKTA